MNYTATYSPEDNKLRLYSLHRLDAETYARVKAAGFKWAPKQDLFVAPMWTPSREDLLLELADEIGDEDTSLVDRAEQRAERFSDYKESRIEDAERARKAVASIADNIPLGQPILIGHHSERHARKDAERIQNGMRKTVQMWETANYWEQRAAGALRHAKYKELPAVRHRRIKGLEADQRKVERSRDEVTAQLATWQKIAAIEDPEKQKEMATLIAGRSRVWVKMPRKEGDRPDFDQSPDVYTCLTGSYPSLYAPRTVAEVIEHVLAALSHSTRPNNSTQRWIDHYTNRIAYEKAMIGEAGGLAAESFDFQPGGKVLRRGQWYLILKVNKRGGVFQSVTVSGHFASTISADEIKDYQAPKPEETAAVIAATKLPPMCNYPGEGFKHMTTDEWKRKKMSDVSQAKTHAATDTHGKHRTRSTWGGNWTTVCVYLTDAKRVDPPAIQTPLTPTEPTAAETLQSMAADLKAQNPLPKPYTPPKRDERIPTHDELHGMKQTAAAGVQVVAVPQLFPTPPDLAARMVELAEIEAGHSVLEPSAGTGAILAAMPNVRPSGYVTTVEINQHLASALEEIADQTICGDFLEQNGNLGKFDRILMNPPFVNGADIKHITHATNMLKPGGRLVAICANGPRQQATLKPLAENSGGWWEELPAGTFAEQGTNVNTALLVIEGTEETSHEEASLPAL